MAGPGGWRDKEVTDLGHLPVSRRDPSTPKLLSSFGSEHREGTDIQNLGLAIILTGPLGQEGTQRAGFWKRRPLDTGAMPNSRKGKGTRDYGGGRIGGGYADPKQ